MLRKLMARAGILRHIDALRAKGREVHQVPVPRDADAAGTYVPPTLIELKDLSELERDIALLGDDWWKNGCCGAVPAEEGK